MNVKVSYASPKEADEQNQISCVYPNLKFSVEGPIEIVAVWIDEHLLAGSSALSQSCLNKRIENLDEDMRAKIIEKAVLEGYEQGKNVQKIIGELEKLDFAHYSGGGLSKIERFTAVNDIVEPVANEACLLKKE